MYLILSEFRILSSLGLSFSVLNFSSLRWSCIFFWLNSNCKKSVTDQTNIIHLELNILNNSIARGRNLRNKLVCEHLYQVIILYVKSTIRYMFYHFFMVILFKLTNLECTKYVENKQYTVDFLNKLFHLIAQLKTKLTQNSKWNFMHFLKYFLENLPLRLSDLA